MSSGVFVFYSSARIIIVLLLPQKWVCLLPKQFPRWHRGRERPMLKLIRNIFMEWVKLTPIPVGQLLEINYDPFLYEWFIPK